jgi:hypothetical protein
MARTPFFGRGPAPQIARMDMQAATAPGRAYRDAFENLGKVAADTLEKFREKKEEKDREDNFERMANKLPSEVFSAFGVQSEEEKSDFIKSIKKKGPREDAMAVMSFFQKAQDAQEASRIRDLQKQQIMRNMERQESADQLAEEERNKEEAQAQAFDKFLTGREMIDKNLGRTDTNPLMRNVPGPTVQVPQGDYKGNRFMQTEQGRNIFNSMVDSGMDPSDALATAGKFEAQVLANQPKAPNPFEAKKYFDKSVNDMRKEYNSLDEVKAFKPVRAAFLKVKQSAEKPSAAGDLALVFNYMKILDPGSVVREGEFKTAADATAWLQKSEAEGVAIPAPIAQAIRKLKDGTILTDAQRKDFVNIARKAASAQFAPVKDSYMQYRNIVNQMQLPEGLTLPDNYQMIEDELAGQIPIQSSSNAITTDQGDYTIPGLSVEAQ